ncbi:translocation/assembly module TamB domain-containing protein [Sulfuricurvum sp.]|uniref:translocation/assembly module TamB domain-containing protein n=1 Tax=Sulfuricurvum sp. TaxID=2025608 RepID=UPI0026085189|nr:translocation/assembly module TamB domain-containing protein [Sulfuricurvum sp.]MDD2780386.1 translocation/assembly module TamB domain-containing protein [Sulfuricurvum sp.]
MKRLRLLPWLKWLKHLFVTLHFLLYSVILLASAALYIAFRPDSLEIINTYFLEPLGVHYTHAEGSILEGFVLHNVRSDTMEAKTLVLQYNLVKMLEGEHTIDSIKIDGLRLHLDDFISDEESIWPFPTFKLRDVSITNLQLISAYPVELDLRGKNGSYDGDSINFASLTATLKSRYASGAIRGVVRNSSLKGLCDLYPNARELAPLSGRFTTLPRTLRIKINDLSADQALLQTAIARLESKQDPSVHAEAITLNFRYVYENDYLDIDALYRLVRANDSLQTKQHLRYALDGTTTTEFDALVTSEHPLPANTLHGEFTDSSKGLSGLLQLDGSTLQLASTDYERFNWKLRSEHKNLSFIQALPETLRSSALELNAKGNYLLSTNELHGDIQALHDHAHFKGTFSIQNSHHSLDGNLTLMQDAAMWKNWAHKPPEHLILSLDDEINATRLQLSGESLALNASLRGDNLKGSGNYLGAFFDIDGSLGDNRVDIDLLIPSLFSTLSKLEPIELHKGEYYDAEIRARTHIDFTNTLTIKSELKIPWYAAVLDSQRAYAGTNGSMSVDYRDGNITINRYQFEIADHPIFSDKTSHIHLSSTGEVMIDEFWIYDSLLLSGNIQNDLSAALRLQSDRFSYKGPEGEAHARTDLAFTRDADANQNLSGSLTFLDATITYLPLQQFKVMDDDIIIIQDVRPPSSAKFAMNLHITADEPIHFKTKELDIRLNPDITLWKDPTEAMQILGMVTIPNGTATTAGKLFTLKHSEIYFGGDVPLNPYLNLTIGHEVNYNKILIYVTHTLDSPIFLFSSDPVMSQNDIMSYILFGSPANAIGGGDNSTTTVRADATNFMLGAGLKGLISGATKLQIDTMNILTTAEGGMGFEVGARLNKDLRVIYKNDTVSSVLLQYTVNRWLRLDADIHELGQGINAIYIKDFRDFLPHNPPKKK